MLRALLSSVIISSMCFAPTFAQQATDAVAPEKDSQPSAFGYLTGPAQAALAAKEVGAPTRADNWMIAAANPLAVEAGAAVLKEGGTAADAVVAVQAVLGLVEPQSSGLGGGAFLVWYDATSDTLTTLDGRETAPLAVKPTLFQTDDGEPMGFWDAVVGGRSVGTPGTPMLMEEVHARWGRAEWSELFQTAILLAEEGFTVSERLALSVAEGAEHLQSFKRTADYFFPDGQALQAGDTLANIEYANTLRTIAAHGSAAFYHGPIADDIVATVRTAAGNPGVLSKTDLAIYRVIERDPVCVAYRTREVCGMGPPSSGALTVGQILGMLGRYDLAALGPDSAEAWRLIGDASRLAFADRGRYMADSDFVPMPTEGLTDAAYLNARADLLAGDDALPEVSAGLPQWDHAMLLADDTSLELPSTSHISIVDQYGNALSMTTTIENGFGSRLMVRGFLLNNELTDFSFNTHMDGLPIANRVEPGKRPRSSMSPTIVLQDGKPSLVIGSPGGSRIIGYVAQAIIAHIDWDMDVQQAVSMPHLVNRFGSYDLEGGTDAVNLETALVDMGYEVNARGLNSGLHAIQISDHLSGGADPRREGIAFGE
ncbi:gamma-glutamyltransferase [Maritimibacter dapengensis]|uniref:Glutathione hydrolase proenzyme n=1 Tax=Maritimibacter dapengensis TaxID=2836868 RepID=A0ABS6T353_9RHOB|nr:gamma-glutamyltransferase [Maritimibacter dapengensis]MBV7379686.1 gamma-glutamyltransferase [Maritimibacter dapengensis]